MRTYVYIFLIAIIFALLLSSCNKTDNAKSYDMETVARLFLLSKFGHDYKTIKKYMTPEYIEEYWDYLPDEDFNVDAFLELNEYERIESSEGTFILTYDIIYKNTSGDTLTVYSEVFMEKINGKWYSSHKIHWFN